MPSSWRYTLRMLQLTLPIFMAFRLVLLFLHTGQLADASFFNICRALLIGLRFDLVISCYFLLPAYLALSVRTFIAPEYPAWKISIRIWSICIFTLSFLVCAADIPWYGQFSSRFNISAFQWMDHPGFVVSMIFGEPRYWMMLLPFGLAVWLFTLGVNKWALPALENRIRKKWGIQLLWFAGGMLLMIIGVRGRLEPKSPIRMGTAYFSENSFLNQLGLNPNYTLMRTYLDSRDPKNQKVHFMEDNQVFPEVAKDLGIEHPDPKYPLLREVMPDSSSDRPNVVLILMESMNAEKMAHFGNENNLTPFLDSLLDEGLSFPNAYSAGTHTYHGIFSTLFSYPALFTQHPMKIDMNLKYHGLPSELKRNGYQTIYFTTHDGQFDNAEGFLMANGIDRVVSNADYPSEEDRSALGVPDDFMFRFGIPVLNELAENNTPFLSVFLTSSDHGPYIIPPYFKPTNRELKLQIVQYADWSLRQFMELAKKQSWYDHTLFVFLADHGSWYRTKFEMSLSFHHMPLLFFRPSTIPPEVNEAMSGQIDVFPTTMGLLNLPYTNNSLGIDLRRHKRPYIYFCDDFNYGAISDSLYLILNRKDLKLLHRYREKSEENVIDRYPEEAFRMQHYVQLHMQAAQMLKEKGLTYVEMEN